MNDLITSSDLNQAPNELKENIDSTPSKKRNYWFLDVDLRKKHDLSLNETVFLGMVQQLQCVKDGFCRAKNYYFIDAMGIGDEWIRTSLIKLQKMGLLWYHTYNTKNGIRRHIVTSDSIRIYQKYLKSHQSWKLLKKFQQDFVLIHGNSGDPAPKEEVPKKDPQVTEVIPPPNETHRPPQISGDGPPQNSGAAINTTYLPNKKNDVTCKSPHGPAASDEACTAAASSKLKEELEHSFSNTEVAIGMQWYEMQSDAKRTNMKKPIACIIQALKGGYAHEEVSAQNAQVAAKLSQQRQEKFTRQRAEKEMSSNEKLSHQLISKFSQQKGWRHSIDRKGFTIFCDAAKKSKDPETNATFYVMPNGEEQWGTLGLRVTFDLPPQEFKHTLKKYFAMSEWSTPTHLEKMEA